MLAKRASRSDDGVRRAGAAAEVLVVLDAGADPDADEAELVPCVVDIRVDAPELVEIGGVARLLYDPVNEYVIVEVVPTLAEGTLRMLDGTAIVAVSLATGDDKSPLMFARLGVE